MTVPTRTMGRTPITPMQMSARGMTLVKSFEGCRLAAYQDSADVWTIGYGHTDGVIEGQTITQDQAETLFREDMDRFAAGVDDVVTVPITQDQFDALVSFAYNVGLEALAHSTLLRLLNEGNTEAAADQFALWCRAGGLVSPGLVRRRAAEAGLFREGIGA